MTILAICRDTPRAKALRPEVRPRHLAYWQHDTLAGNVKLAGPLTDGSGSCFLFQHLTREAICEKFKNDPYTLEGVFENVELYPLNIVLREGMSAEQFQALLPKAVVQS